MNSAAPGTLACFQDDFARALLAPHAEVSPQVAALAVQPGFTVYRNTVMKGCIDALQANYPAVARLVGEEWFRAAAAIYVRKMPPDHPMLLDYGAEFAQFLAQFEPAAEMPYLSAVARLDRLWTESHCARTEEALDAAAVTTLTPEELAATVLRPHAAARWSWFDDAPAYTIWSRNRIADVPHRDYDWRAEGALLVRPHGTVQWLELDGAGCAFLDACAAEYTLATAAQAALQARADADLAKVFSTLLAAGAFGCMTRTEKPATQRDRP